MLLFSTDVCVSKEKWANGTGTISALVLVVFVPSRGVKSEIRMGKWTTEPYSLGEAIHRNNIF